MENFTLFESITNLYIIKIKKKKNSLMRDSYAINQLLYRIIRKVQNII